MGFFSVATDEKKIKSVRDQLKRTKPIVKDILLPAMATVPSTTSAKDNSAVDGDVAHSTTDTAVPVAKGRGIDKIMAVMQASMVGKSNMGSIMNGGDTKDHAMDECTKVPVVVEHTKAGILDSLEITMPEPSKVIVTGVDDSPEDKVLEVVVKPTVDCAMAECTTGPAVVEHTKFPATFVSSGITVPESSQIEVWTEDQVMKAAVVAMEASMDDTESEVRPLCLDVILTKIKTYSLHHHQKSFYVPYRT